MAGQGTARHGMARQGKARRGFTWLFGCSDGRIGGSTPPTSTAWHGMAGLGLARRGAARRGFTWLFGRRNGCTGVRFPGRHGWSWHRQSWPRHDSAGRGFTWLFGCSDGRIGGSTPPASTAGHGGAWHGEARQGTAWLYLERSPGRRTLPGVTPTVRATRTSPGPLPGVAHSAAR